MVLSGTFLVVQPVHLHQHTRAARARKSANMVSALPNGARPLRGLWAREPESVVVGRGVAAPDARPLVDCTTQSYSRV